MLSPEGVRYLWAFRRMRDALLVARANHCSDYHAYPLPNTLHEDSLDRLVRLEGGGNERTGAAQCFRLFSTAPGLLRRTDLDQG